MGTSHSLIIAIVCTGLMAGCSSSPSSDYHPVSHLPARSQAVGDSQDAALLDAPADALTVANSAVMSVRPGASARDVDAPASALKVVNPRKAELLVPEKHFLRDKKTGALRVWFDDLNLLTVLNMEPVTPDVLEWMPNWMKSLGGRTVRVRGYMNPQYQADGIEQFALLRDNKECCFGPNAKIYDSILIRMKDGTTTDYVPETESLDVVGRFRIDLQLAGEHFLKLYVIEDATVIRR